MASRRHVLIDCGAVALAGDAAAAFGIRHIGARAWLAGRAMVIFGPLFVIGLAFTGVLWRGSRR